MNRNPILKMANYINKEKEIQKENQEGPICTVSKDQYNAPSK